MNLYKPNVKDLVAHESKLEVFAENMVAELFNEFYESRFTSCKRQGKRQDLSNRDCGTGRDPVFVAEWDRLPQELWLKIFSHLTQAELYWNISDVCTQWNIWSRDLSLWKAIDFHEMHKDLETIRECVVKMDTYFPHFVDIDCFEEIITSHCEHIESIKMSRFVDDCALGIETLRNIFKCANLTTLDLGFSDEVDLPTICKTCQSIETLNLEGCKSLYDTDFASIGCLHNLKRLDVSHCARLSDRFLTFLVGVQNLKALVCDGVMHFTDYGLIDFFRQQPLIEELVLDGEDLSDDLVCFAAKNLERLMVFEISFSQSLTSHSILAFSRRYEMKSLKFRKALEMTASSICTVFHPASHYNLKRFTITECEHMDDGALVALATSCPNLECLTLDWCWKITDKSLEMVIKRCKKIKCLSLVGLFVIRGEMWLEDLDVRLPYLQLLDLSDCNNMPDEKLLDLVCRKPCLDVFSYFHDKVSIGTPVLWPDPADGEEVKDCNANEYKCPGEVGVKVDF